MLLPGRSQPAWTARKRPGRPRGRGVRRGMGRREVNHQRAQRANEAKARSDSAHAVFSSVVVSLRISPKLPTVRCDISLAGNQVIEQINKRETRDA